MIFEQQAAHVPVAGQFREIHRVNGARRTVRIAVRMNIDHPVKRLRAQAYRKEQEGKGSH